MERDSNPAPTWAHIAAEGRAIADVNQTVYGITEAGRIHAEMIELAQPKRWWQR